MANPTLGDYGSVLDLKVRQGGTFGRYEVQLVTAVEPATDPITYTPYSLIGHQLRAQIRKDPKKPKLLDVNFEIIDAVQGIFQMWLTETQTKLLRAGAKPTDIDSTYVWDAELVHGADVRPLYYGNVYVLREVTKDS